MSVDTDINSLKESDLFYILPNKFSLSATPEQCNEKYMKKNKTQQKIKRIKQILFKFFKYGPIAGIKHKIYMRKIINYLDKTKPDF